MDALPAYVYIHIYVPWVHAEVRSGPLTPQDLSGRWLRGMIWVWKLNPSPWEEHPVLLTSDLYL